MTSKVIGGPATKVIIEGSTSVGGTNVIGSVFTAQDLKIGSRSVTLTLSTGSGSVQIPDTATVIGVRPVSSSTVRVGLETPESSGTATGDAGLSDLKKGCPVDVAVWTWFSLGGIGISRVLYLIGGTSDVIEVVVM